MRAVVLVGGFGTRLRPLTLTTPKPLLPVGHLSILERVVGHLGRHGITEAVLSLGFQPDAFRDAFPDGRCAGVALHYAVEPEPLDTAGAIRFAALDAGIDDTFVVVNGDVLTDLDVASLIAAHHRFGGEGTIHLTPVADPSAFGVVTTDPDGRVLAFIEKPVPGTAPTNLVNAGTYVLEPSVLGRIAAGRRVSIEREIFPAMVADRLLFAVATDDYWLDAGRPDVYLEANLDALQGRRVGPACAALGEGATVAPDAEIDESIIGAAARVDRGAVVRASVLLPRVVIGAGAVVERSILGAGASIGAGSWLADTVVGDGVVIAPGAVLMGVRVPEAT